MTDTQAELRDALTAKAIENHEADRFNTTRMVLTVNDVMEIVSPLLPPAPAVGEASNALQHEETAQKLMKDFEDEDWNAKRVRLEQNICDAVSALMVEHMGGASATEFPPEEGCPYRISIKFEEVKNGSFN